jgi:molybdopterin molybdotransferase
MSLLRVEEAIARILAGVTPLPAETVDIQEAYGRFLAEDLTAVRSQPPFPASAMDGYAVRAEDTHEGACLKVIGIAAAGHGFAGRISAGETVRIFTGAPVPEGADSILIQENAETIDPTTVTVLRPVEAGRHVRRAGLDFRAGQVLVKAGRRFGPRELSLAAAMGYGAVPVRRRPRVAIIATGDELVPPGTEPGPNQIVASNAVGIAGLARAAGGDPYDLGIVADHRNAITAAIGRAKDLPADILVTLGGASVGDHDLVREALGAGGMTLDFWRIAIRPGKPLMFGRLAGQRVLGLPGNPVSAMVCGLLFLRPLVAAFVGQNVADSSEAAVLAADVPANDARQDYVRATLIEAEGGPPLVTPFPVQDSSMLSTLGAADCLLIRPPNAPAAKAGDRCRIVRLP